MGKIRLKWIAKLVNWEDLETFLNDLQDDGYEIESIFEEKTPTDKEKCMVIAKDIKTYQPRRFY